MLKALFVSSLVVNLGLLLGRFSGFVREAIVAFVFGAGADADVVVLMLTVPDMLVNLLVGGALGAALIPEFSHELRRARALLVQGIAFFGLVFSVVAVGLYWQMDKIVALLAPGFSDGQSLQAADALRWVIGLVPLTVLAGVVTAYLHAQHKFSVAALGTLMVNVSIIVGLVLVLWGYGSLEVVAAFVLIGGGVRLVSQLIHARFDWTFWGDFVACSKQWGWLSRYGQAMLSGGVLLLFPVVARAFASFQGEGGVALLHYALRLVEFPLAVGVTFLAVVFFPRLAHAFKTDQSMFKLLVRYGVQLTLALSVLALFVFIILRESYVGFVYGYGGMSREDLYFVMALIFIGLLALPFQGLSVFLTAVFNAQKNMKVPLLVNAFGLVLFASSAYWSWFGDSLMALMTGLVMSYFVICVFLFGLLRIEQFEWFGVFFDEQFLSGFVVSVGLFGFAVWGISFFDLSGWFVLLIVASVLVLSVVLMTLLHAVLRQRVIGFIQQKCT